MSVRVTRHGGGLPRGGGRPDLVPYGGGVGEGDAGEFGS
ncbi:hypothetical protein STRTUCAR8_01048 [Streptomyces turgidiscabies Car8]|uniref:Uncharacterized protein n=1 Tax=Streptomyces turgidiscabies (strain Car8) TaxID=698760 RepID=L7F611_STRT8|nr:hypothetical protein STRTUCAR8_01048 [Streptomyces turgidiscabies Car8]